MECDGWGLRKWVGKLRNKLHLESIILWCVGYDLMWVNWRGGEARQNTATPGSLASTTGATPTTAAVLGHWNISVGIRVERENTDTVNPHLKLFFSRGSR